MIGLSTNYRYGFNGQEKDNEVKGVGNSLDFGARIYDSRLGRFLSLDPLAGKFPWQSPYIFAGNNPIFFIDENGEFKVTAKTADDFPMLTLYLKNYVANDVMQSTLIVNGLIYYSRDAKTGKPSMTRKDVSNAVSWNNDKSPTVYFDLPGGDVVIMK
jgi:RHS repeat-associated protein